MKLLLLEHEITVTSFLVKTFSQYGFFCVVANSVLDALDILQNDVFDVVIADLCFPGKEESGMDFIKMARENTNATIRQIPILIFTGEQRPDCVVDAILGGASEFIVKPCNAKEIVARVYNVVRKAHGTVYNTLECSDLKINITTRKVFVKDQEIQLTAKEYLFLETLMFRMGSIVSKRIILSCLYNTQKIPTVKIVDVLACKVRRKIAEFTTEEIIETSWGCGYSVNPVSNKKNLQINPKGNSLFVY